MADLTVVVCGSLRKNSHNGALARPLPKLTPAGLSMAAPPSFEAIVLNNQDIRDVAVPEVVAALAAAVRATDAFVIVSPEYDGSIPGPTKNAIVGLSELDNQLFNGKPGRSSRCRPARSAALVFGGARMQ